MMKFDNDPNKDKISEFGEIGDSILNAIESLGESPSAQDLVSATSDSVQDYMTFIADKNNKLKGKPLTKAFEAYPAQPASVETLVKTLHNATKRDMVRLANS